MMGGLVETSERAAETCLAAARRKVGGGHDQAHGFAVTTPSELGAGVGVDFGADGDHADFRFAPSLHDALPRFLDGWKGPSAVSVLFRKPTGPILVRPSYEWIVARKIRMDFLWSMNAEFIQL